ncbi:hypothetical protein [Alloactinosynnema sp. L-07]|uniref:hypothetical protein n=1 Tax=Alloactinosynnema sp. L-07 TaxID=1653480 RepID=UPI00065F07A3|nr:hypothetical protein [Alloactinosynnema sp. L-07]CRK61025.1 hypothetical protein [Alloactinosynnema sp. L-07]
MIHRTPAMIATTSFAEYATSDRTRRTEIVAGRPGVDFYGPILRALRQAAASDEPEPLLSAAIDATDLSGQSRAYTELSDGFLTWWPRTRATLTSTGTSNLRVGDVDVSVAPHLGMRSSAGEHAVLFHLKEQPLTKDAANAALRVLQICMSDLLPGATPLVVDLRRAREFRLARNTNVERLDAWLTAQAAALATHLHESE